MEGLAITVGLLLAALAAIAIYSRARPPKEKEPLIVNDTVENVISKSTAFFVQKGYDVSYRGAALARFTTRAPMNRVTLAFLVVLTLVTFGAGLIILAVYALYFWVAKPTVDISVSASSTPGGSLVTIKGTGTGIRGLAGYLQETA